MDEKMYEKLGDAIGAVSLKCLAIEEKIDKIEKQNQIFEIQYNYFKEQLKKIEELLNGSSNPNSINNRLKQQEKWRNEVKDDVKKIDTIVDTINFAKGVARVIITIIISSGLLSLIGVIILKVISR